MPCPWPAGVDGTPDPSVLCPPPAVVKQVFLSHTWTGDDAIAACFAASLADFQAAWDAAATGTDQYGHTTYDDSKMAGVFYSCADP